MSEETKTATATPKSQPSYEMAMDFPYVLDKFQRDSIDIIEQDENVLVTAHTSAGKSTVAEYAIAKCAKLNKRVIYTSPIKTLSNQKFHDFRIKSQTGQMPLDENDIGIMTGDIKLNPDAQCVVMTTEILRNMLYKDPAIFDDVKMVIFDEIHYINNKERGHVWEESIIMLPQHINLIMLSATISKADEFAGWIDSIRDKKTTLISTLYRPTPLVHYVYTNDEIKEIMREKKGVNTFNRENYTKVYQSFQSRFKSKKFVNHKGILDPFVNYLRKRDLLSAIVFSFSRKKCEEYAQQITTNLVDNYERSEIEKEFKKNLHKLLNPENRNLKQVQMVKNVLVKGIGIHHSGLLPALKEIVEILFAKGLIKLLFATETFAVGVNMPARTVVFTELTKYDDSGCRPLQTDEYLQMAGRAGRRGLDTKGNVIYVPLRNMTKPIEMASIVSGNSPSIVSQFQLDYKFLLKTIQSDSQNSLDIITRSLLNKETNLQIKSTKLVLSTKQEEYKTRKTTFTTTCGSEREVTTITKFVELKELKPKSNADRKQRQRNLQATESGWMGDRSKWQALLKEYEQLGKLETEIEKMKIEIDYLEDSARSMTDYVVQLLESLGYINFDKKLLTNEDTSSVFKLDKTCLTVKGVLACDVNECNSLLLTEMLTVGMFDDLNKVDIIALLAIFMEEKSTDGDIGFGDLAVTKEVITKMSEVNEINNKLLSAFDKFQLYTNDTISLNFVDYAYYWAQGFSFPEIQEKVYVEIYEGNFIRNMLKLNNIIKEVVTILENTDTNNKLLITMSELEELIVRDIVSVISLYLK
jgi:superfamily II RNA helicase